MTLRCSQRSWEERTLLNPAFVGLLVHQVADGYQREGGSPLPFVLAFVACPIVLHGPTRRALPSTVRTSMAAWLQENPRVLVAFPSRAESMVPAVREGALFAATGGAVIVTEDAGLLPGQLDRRWRAHLRSLPVDEVELCRDRALFLGRWLSRAGPPATIMSLWGVRP